MMFPKVNYIGNKQKLSNWILDKIPSDVNTVLDAFAGGGSVSYTLKSKGYNTISNDVLYSSYVLNKSFIENSFDTLDVDFLRLASIFKPSKITLDKLSFLKNNLYFPEEVDELAGLIDYAENNLFGYKYYIFLSLIRRAMIRKLPYSRMNINWDNIVKLRDEDYSYKKYGRRRAYHNKSFIYHMSEALDEYNLSVFNSNKNNIVEQLDIFTLLDKYPKGDLIYLDPPYPGTMNNYDGFYGYFDKIFNKNISYTDLTKKKYFLNNMSDILFKSKKGYKYAMISSNSSISPSFKEFVDMLKKFGSVEVFDKNHDYKVSGSLNKHKNIEKLVLIEFFKS